MTTPGCRPEPFTTVDQLRERLNEVRRAGGKIGLVPTMGALHEGHLSLVRASRAECDHTVVSIYVNPSQFGPGEDLEQYPRTLDADLDALARCGVESVFLPANDDVYPSGYSTWVEVGSVARPLEGESRPAHFRGVATVVLKLFNMVGADVAYFGQKDYQQALVIRRMVADLNLPITIMVCPIIRESDGLAMSSRNEYLSPRARRQAVVLHESLQLAEQLVREGERDAAEIVQRMRRLIMTVEGATIDYIALGDPETLEPIDRLAGQTLVAVAVQIENTRLIDNCLVEPPTE